MLELVVIPTILLFGLGFLLWDITDSNDDVLEGELPNEPPSTFFRLTDDADTFEGEPGNQIVFSLGGNDNVTGGTGDDELILGSGDDKSFVSEPTGEINIVQFLGDDTLIGEAGNDQLIDTNWHLIVSLHHINDHGHSLLIRVCCSETSRTEFFDRSLRAPPAIAWRLDSRSHRRPRSPLQWLFSR